MECFGDGAFGIIRTGALWQGVVAGSYAYQSHPPLHGRVSGPKDEARVQGTNRCLARPWGRLHRNVEVKAGPGGGGSAHLAPSHLVDSVLSGLRYGCGSDAAAPTARRAAANGINFAACCS